MLFPMYVAQLLQLYSQHAMQCTTRVHLDVVVCSDRQDVMAARRQVSVGWMRMEYEKQFCSMYLRQHSEQWRPDEIEAHICILYSPGPAPAGLAHRMGIWSNPLKNGLIQHTSRKIPSNT